MVSLKLHLLVPLLLVITGLVACNATTTSAAGRTPGARTTSSAAGRPPGTQTANAGPKRWVEPTPTANYVVNGAGNSAVEQAHAQLSSQGNQVYLIIVSSQSTGIEAEIYQDLTKRDFRATVGPDEGIDTHAEFCYPNCVFVPVEAVNAIGVDTWVDVLKHEYRHITQAKNNPTMAQDFRDPNGEFTPYAAFSEACADYGLNVAPVYEAQTRIDALKNALGADQQETIDQACSGDKSAYQKVVDDYNRKMGQYNTFQALFLSYQ